MTTSNKTLFSLSSGLVRPIKIDGSSLRESLPVGNYGVGADMGGFFLSKGDDFVLPSKMYGEFEGRGRRILRAFEHRTTKNTGALFTGQKGSGKTLLSKWIAVEAAKSGVPTLTINSSICKGPAFNDFLNTLPPAVVIFDEMEKVYDKDEQKELLTLFDGVAYTPNRKLFIITANDSWNIDEHFMNRPGRILYYIEYGGIGKEVITEYCNDILDDKSQIPAILGVANYCGSFTFDMLTSLVEEVNRVGGTVKEAIDILNIREDRYNRPVVVYKVFFRDIAIPEANLTNVVPCDEDGDGLVGHIMLADQFTIGMNRYRNGSLLTTLNEPNAELDKKWQSDLLAKYMEHNYLSVPRSSYTRSINDTYVFEHEELRLEATVKPSSTFRYRNAAAAFAC